MEDKESGRGETVMNGPAASTTPSTAARGSSFGYATLGGMNTKNRASGGGNQAPNNMSSNASASVSSVPQNFPFIVHPYDVSRGSTSTSSKSSGSRGAKPPQSPFSSSTASNNLASASSIALETTSGSAMKPEQVLYGSPYVKAVLLNLWDFSSGPRTEQIWVGQSLKPSGENTKEEIQTERRAKGREEDEFNRSSRPVRSTSSSSLSSRPSTFNGNGDPMTTMLHGTVSLEALDHAHLSTSPPPPPVLSNIVPRPSMKVTKLLSRSGGAAGRGGVEDAKLGNKTGASPSLSDAVMDPSISSAAVQISTNRDSVGAVRTSAEANLHDGTHAQSPASYDDDDSSDSLSQMIDENYVAKQRPPPKKGEINKKLRGRPLVASSHPKHSKTSQSPYSNGDNQELREDNSVVKNDHVYLADGDQDVARDEEVTLTSGGAIDSAPDSSLESPDLGFSKSASSDLLSSSQDDPSNYSECVEEGVVEEGTATSTTSDLDDRGDSETSSEDAWSDEDEGEEIHQDLGGDCPENSDDNAECDESSDDDDDDLDDGSDDDDEDWDQKQSNPSIRNPQRRYQLESSSGAYFSDEDDDGEDFKQRSRYLLPKEYLESNIHPNNTQEEARNRARRRRKRRQKKGEVRRIFESGNIVSISSYIAKYTLGSDLAELVSSSSTSGSQGPQQGGIMMDPWNITSLPPPPASTSPTPTMNSSSNASTQGDNPVSSMLGDGGSFFAQQVMSSTMANIFGGSSSQSGGSGGGSSGYSSSSGVEMGTKSFASASKKSVDDLTGGGSGDYLDGYSQGRGTDSPHPSSSAAAMLPGEDDDEAVAKLGVEHKLHVFEDAPYFTLSAVFTAPYNVKISSPSGATSGNASVVTASSNTMLHSASAMLGFTSPLDPPTPASSSHNPSSTTSTSSTLIPSFSADPTKFSFSILLPYESYPSFLRHQTAITDRLNQWVVFYVYLCQLRPQQALVLVHKEIVRSVLQINRLLACEGIPLPSLKHTLFSVAKSTSIDPNHSSFGSSHASGTSKNGKGSHQTNATGAASQNGNTGQAAPNSPRGGHSPSPFPPSLLASPHLHGSANQFDFTSGDEASFGSTPSGPSFANQSLYSLAAATSASEYPTSGYDMSGAGFTSSPSSSAAELPPFLPLSTFPSGHPTPLSGTDCPSPGGNQPDSGKWRLGDPGKMTMNSMPTPSVSLSSKAHASLAASAAQLSASSDGREGVLMEGGQPKFESNPSSPVLSQHAAANLPEMDYRRTRDFLSLILTSHFQTHQRTVIMGDDLDLVNLYVATISLFLSPEDRQKSRYATYHNIPSFLGGKTSNPHKTATSPVGSASSLSGVTSTHGAPTGGLASPMGSQTALPTSTHRHRSYSSSSGPQNAETSTVHQGQTSRGGSGEIRGTTKASTPQPTTIVSSGSFHDSNEMETGQQQEGAEGQRSTNTQGKDGSATNPGGAPMAAGRRTVHSSRSSSNLQGMMSAAGVGPGGQASQVGGLSSTLNPSYLNPVHPTSYTAASSTTGSSSSQSFAAHQMHSHFFMDGFVPDLVLQGIHGNSKMVRNSAYIQGQMPVTLVDLNRRLVTQTHPFHQFRLLRCEYHQSVLYKLLRVKKTNLWSSQETLFQTVKEPSSFIRKLVLESMRIPDSLILPFISISLKNIMARTYTLVKYVEGLEQGFPPYPASSSTRTAQPASDPAHRDDSSTFGEETTSRTGEEARSTESKSSSPGLTPSPTPATPTSTSAFSSFFSSVKGGDSKQGTSTPTPLNASSQSAGGPVSANTTLLSSNTIINTGAAAQGMTISPHPSNAYYSTGPAVPSHSDPYADLQFSDAHSSNPRIHPAKNSASLTSSTNTPSPTPPPSIDTSLAIIDLGDGTTASALPALSSSNSLTSIFASPPANLFHHHHHHLYQHNHATTPSLSASQYGVSMTDIRSNPSILRRIRHDLDLDEPCFTVLLGIAELLKPGIFRALFGDPMSQEKKWIELFEGL